MRKSFKMLGGVVRRIAAAGVAAAMALSMVVSGPVTALATEGATTGVTIDKTADGLDENGTTDVTLSVGATQSEKNVAVLFVLDYSTSVNVRGAANAMIQELASKNNVNVKACVINYWADADEGTWTTVDESTTLDSLVNKPNASGTNYHAGLLAAQAALQDPEIAEYETYLVTISDGITYLWTDETTGYTMSVWYQNRGNGEQDIQNGNSVYDMKYGQGNAIPTETFNALVSGNIATQLANTTRYFSAYGSAKPDPSATDSFISYYGTDEEYENKKTNYLIGTEIAIAKTAAAWRDLVNSVDNAYAFKLDENHWDAYPYGQQLMNYMISQAKKGGVIEDSTAADVFSGIKNEILYEIKSGTVTDEIGAAFDLAGVDSFKMTVGGQELTGTVNGNTVSFADGNYVVTYYPKGDADRGEYFTWTINVPVEQVNGITLTYTLKLVDVETAAGDYDVLTNEKATITYEGTDGTEGKDTFPVPTVSYTVEEAPVQPQQPERPATNKKEPLAQTGDPTSFVALGALLATGVGAGAAGVIIKRRNR